MPAWLSAVHRLHPFTTPDARRLALLFGVVYWAQGMYDLPTQTLTLHLKEHFTLTPAQAATFFLVATVPWFVKPAYGLLSDFVPLLGRRRKSYFLIMSALAAVSGFTLSALTAPSYWTLAVFVTLMALGLAFTDVLTDALMVEAGRPRGLTGAFQSVQWASIYTASMLVGIVGGQIAARRALHLAFIAAACFPLISFAMAAAFIKEAPARVDRAQFHETWEAIRGALTDRSVWVVAAFIFLFNFSPSFGPAFFYYQTDVLKFSQEFIGVLGSLAAGGAIAGAFIYAPLSRERPLKHVIVVMIGVSAVSTLGYLFYGGRGSALVIDPAFGVLAMIMQLALLDLAAKACPPRVEGTFFALLMSVYNLGTRGSQIVGGYLYEQLGYTRLVLISAAVTGLMYLLLPLVNVDRIEAHARARAAAEPSTIGA